MDSSTSELEQKASEKKDKMLAEKARSVIDAVIALNSLGSDDEGSRCENKGDQHENEASTGVPKEVECDVDVSTTATEESKTPQDTSAPIKPQEETINASLYWLNDSIDDLSGMTFPQKMHHVLRNKDHADIISWLPSGRSFVVRDSKKFSAEIVPKYFGKQHVAYTSFTRRLARWGWQNIAKGTYYNKNFNREHPEQCLMMTYSSSVSNKPTDAVPIRSNKKVKPAVGDSISMSESSAGVDAHSPKRQCLVEPQVSIPSIQDVLQVPQHQMYQNAPLYAPMFQSHLSNAAGMGFTAPQVNPVQQANLVGLAKQMLMASSLAQKHREMEQVRHFLALQEMQARSRDALAAVAAARAESSPPSNGQGGGNQRNRDSKWYRNAAA